MSAQTHSFELARHMLLRSLPGADPLPRCADLPLIDANQRSFCLLETQSGLKRGRGVLECPISHGSVPIRRLATETVSSELLITQ